MDPEDLVFTGFFNDGYKRVDIVLVLQDDVSDEMEAIRLDYFISALKFGLELEIEPGKMDEHKNLIFVKVHAPVSIIEEYGIFFNHRKFFKETHIEFIHPTINVLGVKHEKDFIKMLREQYPGSGNYSTLERSLTVYEILLRLPFGRPENYYGLNRLLSNNIILDAYALHDGPYFLTLKQDPAIVNSRQILFYHWTGKINLCKSQPVHLIREYFGERVAFFFAFYDYLNMMLLIASIIGAWVAVDQLYRHRDEIDYVTEIVCQDKKPASIFSGFIQSTQVCPECINFTYCPMLHYSEYCEELKFINMIDTPWMFFFAFFISVWALAFAIFWKRKENYLTWMWEVNQRQVRESIRPEYESHKTRFNFFQCMGLKLDFGLLWMIFVRVIMFLLTLAILGAWMVSMFILSSYMCHFKHWRRYKQSLSIQNWKQNEKLYIGVGATIYAASVVMLKYVARIFSYLLTDSENWKTFGTYDKSLAYKLYAFTFSSNFALLTCYAIVGELVFTHPVDKSRWFLVGGVGMLNNGLGTSLDDICITLGVAVFVEEILFKLPIYLLPVSTDYNSFFFDPNIPCWEREYQLKNLTESYFHNRYSTMAIQFALATLFAATFPIAPVVILLINIWDIRHNARQVLLKYRRPLLLNATGPGVWHTLIYITAHAVPVFNAATIALQSRLFFRKFAYSEYIIKMGKKALWHYQDLFVGMFGGFPSLFREYKNMMNLYYKKYVTIEHCWSPSKWYQVGDKKDSKKFVPDLEWWHIRTYRLEFIILCEGVFFFIKLLLHFLFPSQSKIIRETSKREEHIKAKYFIHKGVLR